MIKKVFSLNPNMVIFHFYSWKRISCVTCSMCTSSSDKAKSLLTPWKFGLTSKSKYSFCISIDTFDWCLLQLINAISKRGTIFKYYFRFDFSIEVLGLVWLLVSCIPRVSSFISIQFFVLNLDFRFGVLSNRFIIFWYSIFILLY